MITYSYLPTQFPDESRNVPSLQVSAVHRLGAAPHIGSMNYILQVKQYAGLTGLEHEPKVLSHTVRSGFIKPNIKTI